MKTRRRQAVSRDQATVAINRGSEAFKTGTPMTIEDQSRILHLGSDLDMNPTQHYRTPATPSSFCRRS